MEEDTGSVFGGSDDDSYLVGTTVLNEGNLFVLPVMFVKFT